jgi:outer membrane protein OmpA-like peptidoglycan-associated protein
VLIDSQPTGQTTPADVPIKDLEHGTHTIAVRKVGFEMIEPPLKFQVESRGGRKVATFPSAGPELIRMRVRQEARSWPLHFDHAITVAANALFTQVDRHRGSDKKPTRFVTDPVIDANTGEVTNLSVRVEDLLRDEVRHAFPHFAVAQMTSQNIDDADYVVTGIIPLENRADSDDKSRHLSLSILDRKTAQIVAHSDAWIDDISFEIELTPLYRDSPMYLKDRRVEALIKTAKAVAGGVADKEYFDSLATSALLSEAARAYDQGNYRLALGLFAKAAERADGKVMKTYSGLYQSFFKLEQLESAAKAFARLTELGMRNGNLGVKFLFNVNATDFYGEADELRQYPIWIQQIAGTIMDSEACVLIVGHASHSGTREHNLALSDKRANLVRDKLQAEEPAVGAKTSAVGRGFDENIVGTGSNDAADAIDRRVEFKLSPCGT